MRAMQYREFGSPAVLSPAEIPDPVPEAGEVLVRVTAAGVSFADIQRRSGLIHRMGWAPPLEGAVVPGEELAGQVVAVGAGGDAAMVGKLVTGVTTRGSYAELSTLTLGRTAPVPRGLDERQAVALLVSGGTATQLLALADVAAGGTVLVQSAGSAVGTLLVQLAKRAGLTVVATAKGEHKLALARELGADVAVDYTTPGWPGRVRTALGGEDVDVVFESVGGEPARAAFDLVKIGSGRMVWFGISSGAWPAITPADVHARGAGLISFRFRLQAAFDRAGGFGDDVLGLAATGDLTPVVGRVFPLAEAAAAHTAAETRTTFGKTVLVP